jgi:hypothetical protein
MRVRHEIGVTLGDQAGALDLYAALRSYHCDVGSIGWPRPYQLFWIWCLRGL